MANRFFVIYPKSGFAETDKIIRDITDRLGIDYKLWSYSDVHDEYDYYKKVVEPAIEKVEFVMVFLNKESENEFLVSESVRFCTNLNKSLIPIKLKNSDVKEKDWNFRSKFIYIQDEKQVAELEEKMRGWLGLAIEYIDLGLPSGTLWKDENESDLYYYDEAVRTFGKKLPTNEQLEELKKYCQWNSAGSGYKLTGPNGNCIFLSAAGCRNCDGDLDYVDSYGSYWSSTPNGSSNAWHLFFNSAGVYIGNSSRCYGRSVRLVKD